MAGRSKRATSSNRALAADSAQQDAPHRPWGTATKGALPQYVREDLQQVYHYLGKDTRLRVGVMMKIPVFIKDPAVALEDPFLGVQEIEVRLEPASVMGPTSSRIAVVDFNADTQQLIDPVAWKPENGWFRVPAEGEWLPDAPKNPPRGKKLSQEKQQEYDAYYRQFIEKTVSNQHFHQMNAWAVVQRVLEFYEDPPALGRAVPWGFDGNRLIVVPHAGYGENVSTIAAANRFSSTISATWTGRATPACRTTSSPTKPGTPSLTASGRSTTTPPPCRLPPFTSSSAI